MAQKKVTELTQLSVILGNDEIIGIDNSQSNLELKTVRFNVEDLFKNTHLEALYGITVSGNIIANDDLDVEGDINIGVSSVIRNNNNDTMLMSDETDKYTLLRSSNTLATGATIAVYNASAPTNAGNIILYGDIFTSGSGTGSGSLTLSGNLAMVNPTTDNYLIMEAITDKYNVISMQDPTYQWHTYSNPSGSYNIRETHAGGPIAFQIYEDYGTSNIQIKSNAIYVTGGVRTIDEGIGIGGDSSINNTINDKRSIQISTDTYFGGVHNNHTGFLMYSVMSGSWGSSELHFAHSTDWASYDTTTSVLKLAASNSTFSSNITINKSTPLLDIRALDETSATLRLCDNEDDDAQFASLVYDTSGFGGNLDFFINDTDNVKMTLSKNEGLILNGSLTVNGNANFDGLYAYADSTTPKDAPAKFGRESGQYISFTGSPAGNVINSVSRVDNPKNLLRFAISLDNGLTTSSYYDLTGNTGTIWHSGNDSNLIKTNVAAIKTGGTLKFNDNVILALGDGSDVEHYWSGSNYVTDVNGGGNWIIRDGNSSNTDRFIFEIDDGRLSILSDRGGDWGGAAMLHLDNNATTAGETAVKYTNSVTDTNAWFNGLNQDANMSFAYGTSFTDANTKFEINVGGTCIANGEIISKSNNGLRIVSGDYGFFIRNDGTNTYFLFTASGDQYGSYNGLRPLYINNATGSVTSNSTFSAQKLTSRGGYLDVYESSTGNHVLRPVNSAGADLGKSWYYDSDEDQWVSQDCPIYMGNTALISAGSQTNTNCDHIWHEDGNNRWHFCSDTTYRSSGNSKVYCGSVYATGNISALSFTDRTPYPETLQQAKDAINSMQRLPEGEYDVNNKEHQLDHSKMTDFIKDIYTDDDGVEQTARDLSATVSCLVEVVKDLMKEVEELKSGLSK
jgi:hypothetical protein